VPRWQGIAGNRTPSSNRIKEKPSGKSQMLDQNRIGLEHLTSPFIRISDADRETKATETWRGESLLKVTSGKSP
jgi:hypothetical protein